MQIMKICLLYPKWTGEYGIISHFAKKAAIWPPLNLAYLAAVAEDKGHEVIIMDGEAERMPLKEMVDRTLNFNPDIIGITATTPFYHIAVELANELKKKTNVPITVGGPHITVLKEEAFNDCFDYCFIGESEDSWALFLDKKGKDVKDIKGILYRDKGKIKFTGQTYHLHNLDELPLPARHLLKMDKYKIGTLQGRKKFTTIMTVRGCPYKCIFCSTKVFGENIKKRSPKKVVEEMKDVVEKYEVEHFMFLDDVLTLDKNHILNICNEIIKENLKITFEGSTRANLVDEELISKMSEAGLIRLSFGLESVDENIRKIMKKMVSLDSYVEANKLTNKYGIETLNSCMIGLPGESEDTVRKTLKFLRESKEIKQANISIAVPYPGTELYEMAKRGEHQLKLVIKDFSKYRRYNIATMQVGGLTTKDLIDIQNEAFASIYLAPWRWKPMIKKSGFFGAVLTTSRLIKCLIKGKTRYITNKQLGIKK